MMSQDTHYPAFCRVFPDDRGYALSSHIVVFRVFLQRLQALLRSLTLTFANSLMSKGTTTAGRGLQSRVWISQKSKTLLPCNSSGHSKKSSQSTASVCFSMPDSLVS